MMVIQAACDLLHETLPDDPAIRRPLPRIDRALQDMQSLITLFLHLARAPEQLDRSERRQPLPDLVETVVQQWQPKATQQGITLSSECPPLPRPPQVPTTLTASVLSNLLRNALNHTERGAIQVQVSAHGFSVSDSGAGIPTERVAQVLQRGVRDAGGDTPGFGLGLAIVQRICDHQHWELRISANQPTGTRVEVQIPTPSTD